MTITLHSATGTVYELRKLGDHIVAEEHNSPASFKTNVLLVSDPATPIERALSVFAKPEGERDQVVNETMLQPGETSFMFGERGFSKIECE